jgi:hypothetical protein
MRQWRWLTVAATGVDMKKLVRILSLLIATAAVALLLLSPQRSGGRSDK